MIELIGVIFLLFLILTLFYKQTTNDFRINQLEWDKKENVLPILKEQVPLVIRGIPSTTCWSHNDVLARECYSQLPVFKEIKLAEWIVSQPPSDGALCPWTQREAERIARVSGISIWADRWLNAILIPSYYQGWWMTPTFLCWSGKKGLHRTYGVPTCIFPVDGEILVSILPSSMKSNLPTSWENRMPNDISAKDTPFFADLKYIDIILRPGTCLLMPPHWFISWTPTPQSSIHPMIISTAYHTPISRLAEHLSMH